MNEFNALCGSWALRQYTRNQKQASLTPNTRFVHTCCGVWKIDHPNQVWAAEHNVYPLEARLYVPGGGNRLVQLKSIVLARFKHIGKPIFVLRQDAIRYHRCSEIFNTDQGSQFTSADFTEVLEDHGIKISMDCRGRFQDNIFIERLWWTVKHHYVYLRAFENGVELRNGLKHWFKYYNQERFHQSLGDLTPDEVYFKEHELLKAA